MVPGARVPVGLWEGMHFPAARIPGTGSMPGMTHRKATSADYPLLGMLNHQLIRDEGHRNPMNVTQLTERMRRWLGNREYTGRIFEENGQIVAYALYREFAEEIYLRHLFVVRDRRREGFGRRALQLLREEIWPPNRRMTVEVLCGNAAGVAFWKAMGYREYSVCLEIMPEKRA